MELESFLECHHVQKIWYKLCCGVAAILKNEESRKKNFTFNGLVIGSVGGWMLKLNNCILSFMNLSHLFGKLVIL